MSDATRNNIRKLRRLAHMTQDEFGNIANITRGAVSQYETGFSEPKMKVIRSYCDHFEIPTSWITEAGGMDGVTLDADGTFHKDGANDQMELTDREREILLKLRRCPDRVVDAIETIVDVASRVS